MRHRTNNNGRHPWTAAEITRAAALYADYMAAHEGARGAQARAVALIAAELHLPASKVYARLRHYGATFTGAGLLHGNVVRAYRGDMPVDVATERARRLEAAAGASLTATILGDPPPGYSALDRRKAV